MSEHTKALRELCGDLEDMSVFKDTVAILEVRERLEPAVDACEAAVRCAVEALERIVEKCQQYENAPRLGAAEQHAVNEWIEREARAALSSLRPGGER